MALAAFDTLKFANRLKSVGVPLAQAEAEAEVLAEIFEVNLRDLATKEDLQREIGDLRKDMDAKHESLRHEIGDLRKDMNAKHESLRHEIGDLRKDMNAKHESLRKDMGAKLVEVKFDLLKWMIGLAIAQTGLWIALKLFPIAS